MDKPADDLNKSDPISGSKPASGTPLPPSGAPLGERPSFLKASDNPEEIGVLGGYGIRKILGKGGMGMVLLAHERMLDRLVAVKVMLPEVVTPDNRDRFFREARSTAALHHDHVVPVFQVGEENGVPYLVMPYLQGEALDRRLSRERKPPLRETLRIIRETATGLMAAHAKGMIHRDIKPGNIWLEAPRGRVRILDFGLALTRSSDVRITQAGAIMGTPAYMAPEQAAGREVDFRADLFSLGVLLYEMLTGSRPFQGTDTLAILTSLLTTNPTPPSILDETIPTDVSRLAMAMISKDPAKRPPSARDVALFLSKVEKSLQWMPVAAPPAAGSPVVNPTTAGPASTTAKPAGKTNPPGAKPSTPNPSSASAPFNPSPPTPVDQDRIFDTQMIQDAIPVDLRALGPKVSPVGPMEPPLIALTLLVGNSPPNHVKGDKILIGRATGSRLRIQSSQVSRAHARIHWMSKGEAHYTVEDLGSTNGTFINNCRVKQPTALLPGDQLHFGSLGFRIQYPMAQETLKSLTQKRIKANTLGAKRESIENSTLESSNMINISEGEASSSPSQNIQQTKATPKIPFNEE